MGISPSQGDGFQPGGKYLPIGRHLVFFVKGEMGTWGDGEQYVETTLEGVSPHAKGECQSRVSPELFGKILQMIGFTDEQGEFEPGEMESLPDFPFVADIEANKNEFKTIVDVFPKDTQTWDAEKTAAENAEHRKRRAAAKAAIDAAPKTKPGVPSKPGAAAPSTGGPPRPAQPVGSSNAPAMAPVPGGGPPTPAGMGGPPRPRPGGGQ